ncbi:hypothetical protein [Psychromonas aquimarina]|uniref:hypothetical protein n=1 Tax=Psychromonas aquimarina TaxID=444919 RepID=UPI000426CE3D|nr:hypothetical protein [Psychromonas aquimarina]
MSKVSNKKEMKAQIQQLRIAFSTTGDNFNVTIKPLLSLLRELKNDNFAACQSKYLKAKEASKDQVSKDDFFPSFLPHAYYDGQRKLLDENDMWNHNRWHISGLIHADLDKIAQTDFNEVWSRMEKTKPLFMFRSPNGGIKAFWLTDLENTPKNRQMFTKLCRYTVKSLLSSVSLNKYYDYMPTNPNSKCYLTGGENFKIKLYNNAEVVEMEQAITAILNLHNEEQAIIRKKEKALIATKTAGEYVSWHDLSDLERANKRKYAEKVLASAIKSTMNKGNKTSFSLACSCFKIGLDHATVTEYVTRFKQHNLSKMTFTIKNQVSNAMKATGSQYGGGEIRGDNKNYIDSLDLKIKGINDKITALTTNKPKIEVVKTKVKGSIELGDLSELDATMVVGLPGSGKSYQMVRDAIDWMMNDEITIYVCPDKQSFNKTVTDSRYQETDKYLIELRQSGVLTNNQYNEHLLNVQTIASGTDENTGEKKSAVSIQFNIALDELQNKGKGGIIFLTMAGLELVNLDEMFKCQHRIVFDDISSLPTAKKISNEWTDIEVSKLKKYIEFESNGETHKVISASIHGLSYMGSQANIGDKEHMYARVDAAKRAPNLNNVTYYYIAKDELTLKNKITQLYMFNIEKLKMFKAVFFVGDEIENNPYVKMLTNNCGVMFKSIKMKCRSENLQQRIKKIHFVTTHNFAKTRISRIPYLPSRISKTLISTFGEKHNKMLININKDQQEQGIFEDELKDNFDLTVTSPITKGINHLKENSLICCLFNMDLDVSSKHVLSHVTGLTFDDLDNFIHRNNLMQNLFRGVLRHSDDTRECDFVCPTKADAEYLQARLLEEQGIEVDIQLLDPKLSESFKSAVSGRKTKSITGDKMTKAEENIRSRLRKKYGSDVDCFEPSVLLKTMAGLRGQKAKSTFEELVKTKLKPTKREDIFIDPVKKLNQPNPMSESIEAITSANASNDDEDYGVLNTLSEDKTPSSDICLDRVLMFEDIKKNINKKSDFSKINFG